MPLYEYACEQCGREAELLIDSRSQPSCPTCGSSQMTKLLSIVAASLRQSGTGQDRDTPSGPCGSSCACFPSG